MSAISILPLLATVFFFVNFDVSFKKFRETVLLISAFNTSTKIYGMTLLLIKFNITYCPLTLTLLNLPTETLSKKCLFHYEKS